MGPQELEGVCFLVAAISVCFRLLVNGLLSSRGKWMRDRNNEVEMILLLIESSL